MEYFTIRDKQLIVLVIMHTKRKPSDWTDRV